MFFFERTIYRHTPAYTPQIDEPRELSAGGVLLKVLTHADNQAYYKLYAEIAEIALPNSFSEPPIQPNETAESFAKRIVSMCEMLWTIRLANYPTTIIGDCALHHWDRETHEIEFGGSLAPAYWGSGIMAAAFGLVVAFAKTTYGVKALRCSTSSTNHNARRFAEKMGFNLLQLSDNALLLRKALKD